MTLRLNGSTSGYVEIDAPAVAGSTSITLPATSGGEFVVSDSSGNIDLGPLDIDGGASDDSVKIDSSGRLLVGTTTARSNFNLYGTNYTAQNQFESNSVPNLALTREGGAFLTLANKTTATDGANAGTITFNQSDGTNILIAGQIATEIDGIPGTNDIPGRLVFSTTADGDSSPTERVRIDSNGTFWHVASTGYNYYLAKSGAGNTYVAHYISSAEGSGYTYNIFYRDNTNTGSISYNGTGITFNNTSDYRLKENIVPIGNAINRLQQLKPSRFNFIAETGFDCDCTIDGFIAHEVKEVVPEAVTGEKDAVNDDGSVKPQQLDQSKLVPLLTAALQEAVAKIETLETRITALEGGAA